MYPPPPTAIRQSYYDTYAKTMNKSQCLGQITSQLTTPPQVNEPQMNCTPQQSAYSQAYKIGDNGSINLYTLLTHTVVNDTHESNYCDHDQVQVKFNIMIL